MVLQLATELPPLTPEQIAAIKACGFAYTTQSQDHVWLIFDDPEIIVQLGDLTRRTSTYTRDHVTHSEEHEALVAHPEAVRLVLEMHERRDREQRGVQ